MLGVSIGNYKIVEKVGQGGMGTVYRAVHDTLGRSAAVKVVAPSSTNSHELMARLFNEARAATAIRHPGIIEVYDCGTLPDRTAYMIMEFLQGDSLGDRRRLAPLSYLRALQIVRAVARTLHVAHERGIVHRDLKPDNIFLVPDPEAEWGERIKLLDFGIAKSEADGPERALTQTGTMVGTPPYMSPEQCRGTVAVDRRSDLYALGCVLYELVCGRPPFVGRSASEVIAHHLYFPPEPPRSLDEHIPAPLDALVLWLLQKDPRHRPATAAHVVAAIDDLDATAMPGGPSARLTRPPVAADTMPMMTGSVAEVAASTTSRTSRRACERPGRAGRGSLRRRRRRVDHAG